MRFRLILSLIVLGACENLVAAQESAPSLQGGAYEITHRLELPHVERWAIDKTTTVCLAETKGSVPATFPVLSGNNPFRECIAVNINQDGPSLSYDLRCQGRDLAKAHATYTLLSGEFKGRVAMVMGAKNMTMTEVQAGHRLGSCDVAHAARD